MLVSTNTMRWLLFIFGCIPTKLFFATLSYIFCTNFIIQRTIAIFTWIIAFGFLIIWWFNLRTRGIETFGHRIWWNNFRPIHAFLYIIAGYYSWFQNPRASIILLFDVSLSIFLFASHRLISL